MRCANTSNHVEAHSIHFVSWVCHFASFYWVSALSCFDVKDVVYIRFFLNAGAFICIIFNDAHPNEICFVGIAFRLMSSINIVQQLLPAF